MDKIEKINLSQFFVSFLFSVSIFLWSIQFLFIHTLQTYILFRFSYLLLIPVIIYEIIKKKQNLFDRHFLILLGAIIIIFLSNFQIIFDDFKLLSSHLILFLTLFVVYFKYDEIKNIELIIYIFLLLFFISLLISGNLYIPEAFNTYSKWTNKCGGIPIYIFCNDYFSILCETSYKTNENSLQSYSVRNILDLAIIDKVQTFKIGIKEKIFLENSHLSIVGSALTLFLLSKVIDKKSVLAGLIAFFFIMIIFIKSTTTFYLSIFLSFSIIIFLNFKSFTKKKITIFLSTLLVFFLVFVFDVQCTSKIKPVFNVVYNDLLSKLNLKKGENQLKKIL